MASAARDGSGPPARFRIRTRAEPQALVRLIGYFAQQGLVPDRIRCDAADDMLDVAIDQPGLGDDRAGVIAEKMRSSVLVEWVELRCGDRSLS